MKNVTIPLAALSLALFAPALKAQTPNADVQNLMGSVAAAYRSLTTFSVTLQTVQARGTEEQKITSKLVIKKPNLLTDEITISTPAEVRRIVADGTSIFADSSSNKTNYIKVPATTFVDAIRMLTQARGGGIGLLPLLLTSSSAEKLIVPDKATSVTRLPDETVGADACDAVSAVVPADKDSYRYQFDFGKQDHLLRKVSITPATPDAKPLVVETYTDTNLQPTLTDNAFHYTPAPGATLAVPPKAPQPNAPPPSNPRVKAGAVALPISGKDLSGAAVSLSQYKGKVVLLDFWATSWPPSVSEIPSVTTAYVKYHAKGFDVVGIPLDPATSKPQLQKFLQEHKMPWRQIYDGTQTTTAQAYGMQNLPFNVLVGRNGKIAAVNVHGQALAPAIAAALKQQ